MPIGDERHASGLQFLKCCPVEFSPIRLLLSAAAGYQAHQGPHSCSRAVRGGRISEQSCSAGLTRPRAPKPFVRHARAMYWPPATEISRALAVDLRHLCQSCFNRGFRRLERSTLAHCRSEVRETDRLRISAMKQWLAPIFHRRLRAAGDAFACFILRSSTADHFLEVALLATTGDSKNHGSIIQARASLPPGRHGHYLLVHQHGWPVCGVSCLVTF